MGWFSRVAMMRYNKLLPTNDKTWQKLTWLSVLNRMVWASKGVGYKEAKQVSKRHLVVDRNSVKQGTRSVGTPAQRVRLPASLISKGPGRVTINKSDSLGNRAEKS